MYKVKIEDDLNNKDYKWFKKKLLLNKSDFNISGLSKFIDGIENRGDRQIIYYVIYKIITENTIAPKSIKPTPDNGLSLHDYNTGSLAIYHCHLNGDMVLIWYATKDSNDSLNLEIEYIKHPTNYDIILKNIYKTTDGWNTITKKYFKDYRKNTYLKDGFIQKWFIFVETNRQYEDPTKERKNK